MAQWSNSLRRVLLAAWNSGDSAKVTVRDDRHRGPRFVKWQPMPQDAHERDEGEGGSPISASLVAEAGEKRNTALREDAA
jgi:hypothetical protein